MVVQEAETLVHQVEPVHPLPGGLAVRPVDHQVRQTPVVQEGQVQGIQEPAAAAAVDVLAAVGAE